MNRAYVALGSNIGDKAAHLQAAIRLIRALANDESSACFVDL